MKVFLASKEIYEFSLIRNDSKDGFKILKDELCLEGDFVELDLSKSTDGINGIEEKK